MIGVAHILLLVAGFLGAPALGALDEVIIDWQPSEGAAQYELQIKKGKKVVLDERYPSARHQWKGTLPSGFYGYRIRIIDAVGQTGAWSDIIHFYVKPEAPQIVAPAPSGVLIYDPQAAVTLRWGGVRGVGKFALVMRGPGGAYVKTTVVGTEYSLSALAPGNYSWRVKPIVEPPKFLKSEFPSRVLEDKASAIALFSIRLPTEKAVAPLQTLLIRSQLPGVTFFNGDYLCLYPSVGESRDIVGCGYLVEKRDKQFSIRLVAQRSTFVRGGKYYVNRWGWPQRDLAKGDRLPASLKENDLFEIVGEVSEPKVSVSLGIVAGSRLLLSTAGVQLALGRKWVSGLSGFYANAASATDSLKLTAIELLVSFFPLGTPLSGPFAEAGAGAFFFSARTSAGDEPTRTALGASLSVGWHLRTGLKGLSLIGAVGLRYIAQPGVTSLQTSAPGWQPTAGIKVGYDF